MSRRIAARDRPAAAAPRPESPEPESSDEDGAEPKADVESPPPASSEPGEGSRWEPV